MYAPKKLEIRRMIPQEDTVVCASILGFGDVKYTYNNVETGTSAYDTKLEDNDEEEISLFQDQEKFSITINDSSKSVNICKEISDWAFYSIRDLKWMISIFTGAPISHIDLRSGFKSKSLGHISENNTILSIDIFRKINVLPRVIELYLWGDWQKDASRWPEIESLDIEIIPIDHQLRTRVIKEFLQRERILKSLEKYQSIKGIRGNIISTEYTTFTTNTYGLNLRKLYNLLSVNDVIRNIYYKVNDEIYIKDPNNNFESHHPTSSNSIRMQLTMTDLSKKYDFASPRNSLITINDNASVSIFTGWSDIKSIDSEMTKAISIYIIQYIIDIIESYNIKRYTFPKYRLSNENRNSFERNVVHPSKMQYYEMFKGNGSFQMLLREIAEFARAGLCIQQFTGEKKSTFLLPKFDTHYNFETWFEYLSRRLPSDNQQLIWNQIGFKSESILKYFFGPTIIIDYSQKDSQIRCEISNTTSENELLFARETSRRLIYKSGFILAPRDAMMTMGGLSLILLNNTDPILFSSRHGKTGDVYNYSRICQTSQRHPVPINLTQSEKRDKERTVKLNNFTYGGYQYYYCADNKFPFVMLRSVIEDWYVPCCVSTKIVPTSLKAREFYSAAKILMYDIKDIEEFNDNIDYSPYASSLLFTSGKIPKGRLSKFPDGTRKYFDHNLRMFNPLINDISGVISWLAKRDITINSTTVEEIIMESLNKFVPIVVVELIHAGGNTWFPELIIPNHSMYSVRKENHLIFKVEDEYYPIVDKDINKIECPKNIINEFESLKPKTEKSIFTYSSINKNFKIIGQIIYMYRTYALLIQYGNNKFIVPISPINELSDIPHISNILKYLPSYNDVMKFYKYHKMKLDIGFVITSENKTIGIIPKGEFVLILIQPHSKLNGVEYKISRDALKTMSLGLSPISLSYDANSDYHSLIDYASYYISDLIVREIKKEHWIKFVDNKDLLIKTFVKLLKSRKEIKLSYTNNIKIDDGLVRLDLPIKITKDLLHSAIEKIVIMGPRNEKLFYVYMYTYSFV
jgi:hypothetical protein